MEAQGWIAWYKIKRNLWRPKELMLRCQLLPCAGILGLCRDVNSTHMLCWHCCLSHEVFLLGQVGSWGIYPTAMLSLTAATWKIRVATPPALLSALSPPAACQTPCADYTAFIYPTACLPPVIPHAHSCQPQGGRSTIHPLMQPTTLPSWSPLVGHWE